MIMIMANGQWMVNRSILIIQSVRGRTNNDLAGCSGLIHLSYSSGLSSIGSGLGGSGSLTASHLKASFRTQLSLLSHSHSLPLTHLYIWPSPSIRRQQTFEMRQDRNRQTDLPPHTPHPPSIPMPAYTFPPHLPSAVPSPSFLPTSPHPPACHSPLHFCMSLVEEHIFGHCCLASQP